MLDLFIVVLFDEGDHRGHFPERVTPDILMQQGLHTKNEEDQDEEKKFLFHAIYHLSDITKGTGSCKVKVDLNCTKRYISREL